MDDGQSEILGGDTVGERAVDANQHAPGTILLEGLRGQDVFDLAGADADGEGSEGSVSAGVAVSADDGFAGKREAQFGTDDVHDALLRIANISKVDAEVGAVGAKSFDLLAGNGIQDVEAMLARGGHVVIHGAEGEFGAANLAIGQAKTFKGLRGRHLMHEMQINVEQGGLAFSLVDDVRLPELVEEAARSVGGSTHRAILRLHGRPCGS